MSSHEKKYCPRCNSIFECKMGTILLCHCNEIKLSNSEKEYLSKNYNDCLCGNCLIEIKNILRNSLDIDETQKLE